MPLNGTKRCIANARVVFGIRNIFTAVRRFPYHFNIYIYKPI